MSSVLVTDCPRCQASKITFDVIADKLVRSGKVTAGVYRPVSEAFCVCRNCHQTTTFALQRSAAAETTWPDNFLSSRPGALSGLVEVRGYVSLKDFSTVESPEHLPEAIAKSFSEGATCLSAGCFNAAGTMFRLCVDMTTKDKLPSGDASGLNHKVRRDLGLRLPWLFENRLLPDDLRELSHCIKEDGNDGAHRGTLTEADALDLLDFTKALLDRVYTQPERLKLATARRVERRNPA